MKNIKDLADYLEQKQEEFVKNVMEAQRETAEQIWADVIDNAPYKNGDYVSSIQIDPTEVNTSTIKTFIGSDLIVGPAISTGKSYNLGYLLENGTLHHAIPNAFNWGVIYGYESEQYLRTTQDDWHPGSIAIPHYSLALEKNKKLYKDNIRLAWRKTK